MSSGLEATCLEVAVAVALLATGHQVEVAEAVPQTHNSNLEPATVAVVTVVQAIVRAAVEVEVDGAASAVVVIADEAAEDAEQQPRVRVETHLRAQHLHQLRLEATLDRFISVLASDPLRYPIVPKRFAGFSVSISLSSIVEC